MSMVIEPSVLEVLDVPPFPVRRWTVDEYHRLAASGFLGDPQRVELLEGWIVPKMTHSPPHAWALSRMERSLRLHLGDRCYIRVQLPIDAGDSEPEPDIAIVLGSEADYLRNHPPGVATALVVEVAESSLLVDRRKARIYAAAGIPEYWIVNLKAGAIECYIDPNPAACSYRTTTIRPKGDELPLSLPGGAPAILQVSDLIPPD